MKTIIRTIDNMIAFVGGILVIVGLLLALTGHLDIVVNSGMRSAGACFMYIN